MPKCAICKKDRPEGKQVNIYTGKILKEEIRQSGSSKNTQTTYGEFFKHTFFLCKQCNTLWNTIVLPVGGMLTAVISAFLLVLSLRSNSNLTALLLVIVCFSGTIFLLATSIDERLKKKARQERKSEEKSEEKFVAFTEVGYEKLLRENQSQQ